MKSGRALIGIFQKMRIKNLRRVNPLHLGNVENHLILNILRNGRMRVKFKQCHQEMFILFLVNFDTK